MGCKKKIWYRTVERRNYTTGRRRLYTTGERANPNTTGRANGRTAAPQDGRATTRADGRTVELPNGQVFKNFTKNKNWFACTYIGSLSGRAPAPVQTPRPAGPPHPLNLPYPISAILSPRRQARRTPEQADSRWRPITYSPDKYTYLTHLCYPLDIIEEKNLLTFSRPSCIVYLRREGKALKTPSKKALDFIMVIK